MPVQRPSFLRSVRLCDVDGGRANNLNLIRFVLASMVVFTHSYLLLNLFDQEPVHHLLGREDCGTTAVFGFFFLSGYLILRSALSSEPERFLIARALRIFPGLILVVALLVLVLGPLQSSVPLRDYFLSPVTRHFATEAALHANAKSLPGVFVNNPFPNDVDGSLWTLPVEWTCYIAVMLVCYLLRRRSVSQRSLNTHTPWQTWALLAAALLLTAQMLPLPWFHAAVWFVLFCIGCGAYLLRRRLWLSLPAAAGLLVAALLLLRFAPHLGRPVYPFALCYALLCCGFHPAAYIAWYHRIGDYSYGLYIYAWPAQQMAVAHGVAVPLRVFAIAMPSALICAVLSWHFVEQPALRRKAHWTDLLTRQHRSTAQLAIP